MILRAKGGANISVLYLILAPSFQKPVSSFRVTLRTLLLEGLLYLKSNTNNQPPGFSTRQISLARKSRIFKSSTEEKTVLAEIKSNELSLKRLKSPCINEISEGEIFLASSSLSFRNSVPTKLEGSAPH
jgi:hypothetical protein